MKKSIIIIGGGISGLAAGCYAQMNNYDSKILEMHNRSGGLCTSWERNSYTIEGCLHWIVGSKDELWINKIWQELGIIKNVEFLNLDELSRIQGEDNKEFIFYTDMIRLEKHMKELAPEDSKILEELFDGVREFLKLDIEMDKAIETFNIFDWIKFINKMRPYQKWQKKWKDISVEDFAKSFKNPFLNTIFTEVFEKKVSIMGMLMTIGWFHKRCAGYPIGGSKAVVKAIEDRYYCLGGQISFNSNVEKIITHKGKAVGIRLKDGSQHFADVIISAIDGYTTIYKLLDEKYIGNKIKKYYSKLSLVEPLIHISFGVNNDYKNIRPSILGDNILLKKPIIIGGRVIKRINVLFYNYDKSYSTEGKCLVKVMIPANYNYWNNLGYKSKHYEKEKEIILYKILSILEKHYPGFSSKIEMKDIATPLTFEKYTGNRRGSIQGWKIKANDKNVRFQKTLKNLNNFYMIGQWVEPGGGLPPVAMSGRNVIQMICKKDKKEFSSYIQ